MPSLWIDEQKCESLKTWLESTASPMLASTSDSRVLWCNGAFESLIGYTLPEFIREDNPVDWRSLTIDRGDLAADLQLAQSVQEGHRVEYMLTKQYRAKDGEAKDVIIHVLRCPLVGEFECFLVTVHPIEASNRFLHKEILDGLRGLKEQIAQEKPGELSRFLDWSERHPRKALCIVMIVGAFLLGDRFIDTVKDVKQVLTGTTVVVETGKQPSEDQ